MEQPMFVNGYALRVSKCAQTAERRRSAQQFAELRVATGLTLDHVNVHKHFHLHPTLLEMLLRIGREYGAAAVRCADEPSVVRGAGRPSVLSANAALLAPWIALMTRRLRIAQVPHNDLIFGVRRRAAPWTRRSCWRFSGGSPGVTEIYLHPASRIRKRIASSMSTYRHAEELAALLSPLRRCPDACHAGDRPWRLRGMRCARADCSGVTFRAPASRPVRHDSPRCAADRSKLVYGDRTLGASRFFVCRGSPLGRRFPRRDLRFDWPLARAWTHASKNRAHGQHSNDRQAQQVLGENDSFPSHQPGAAPGDRRNRSLRSFRVGNGSPEKLP